MLTRKRLSGTLAFLLIPSFGILGVIIVGSLSGLPGVAISVYWTWKHYEIKADFRNSTKIFLASALAGITTYLILTPFIGTALIKLTVGALIFLVVYLISVPLVGAINQMDINNLRIMFSELGPVSKILEIPLTIIEKPLNLKERISGTYKQE